MDEIKRWARGRPAPNRVVDRRPRPYHLSYRWYYGDELATNVTVKGQVTLPKAVRDAAGIRPGDRVNVRVRPEGGVIIEAVAALKSEQAYNSRLEEMSRRRPIRGLSTEDVMRMTRGED